MIDKPSEIKIEAILQIRHLYAHRNGIVDEKFRQYYPTEALYSEHAMTMDSICDELMYLAKTVDNVDKEALKIYQLATS